MSRLGFGNAKRPLRPAQTLFALVLGALMVSAACATDVNRVGVDASFWRATHLIEVKYDADHSKWMSPVRHGGFETSDGAWVSFRSWYDTTVRNTTVAWMTQIHPDVGLIWGLGTGERGAKYVIAPSLKIGGIYQKEIFKRGVFSLKATTMLGGKLKEKSCVGYYGEIGGYQEVNCRMAASVLAPADTLPYLFKERPYNHSQVMMQFTQRF